VEEGRDIGDVLGLEDAITRPWSDEEPQRVTLNELRRLFGKQTTTAAIQRATALGLIRREGAHYVAPSMRLLQAGSALIREGVPLVSVLDLAEALAGDLDDAARRFIRMVREHLLPSPRRAAVPRRRRRGGPGEPAPPLVRDTVEAVLAIAMERQVTSELGDVMGKISAAADRSRRATTAEQTGRR